VEILEDEIVTNKKEDTGRKRKTIYNAEKNVDLKNDFII